MKYSPHNIETDPYSERAEFRKYPEFFRNINTQIKKVLKVIEYCPSLGIKQLKKVLLDKIWLSFRCIIH